MPQSRSLQPVVLSRLSDRSARARDLRDTMASWTRAFSMEGLMSGGKRASRAHFQVPLSAHGPDFLVERAASMAACAGDMQL